MSRLLYCSVCSIIIQHEDGHGKNSNPKVLQHIKNSDHLKKIELENIDDTKTTIYKIDWSCVKIISLPSFVDKKFFLINFPHYDNIKRIKIHNDTAKVYFNHNKYRVGYDLLTEKQGYWFDGELYYWHIKPIKREKYFLKQSSKNVKTESNSPEVPRPSVEELLEQKMMKLNLALIFDEQLNKFLNVIQPDKELLFDKINKIRQDIFEMLEIKLKLNLQLSTNMIIPFGSSITGLAMTDSDVDISLNLLYADETKNFMINYIASILRQNEEIIKEVTPIIDTKVPIVKFYHSPTKTRVDISLNNYVGQRKTNMIKFCISLDSRIKPLFLVIKYWAKKLGLTGSIGSPTSYFFLMLVFFYLQQPGISLMPHFSYIQELYSIWSFDPRFVETTKNCNMNIIDLLVGFFTFYSKFDYFSKIICPIDGTAPYKQSFQTNNSSLKYNLKLKKVHLLDPLQIETLISCNWSERWISYFSNACYEASYKIQPSIPLESDQLFDLNNIFNEKLYKCWSFYLTLEDIDIWNRKIIRVIKKSNQGIENIENVEKKKKRKRNPKKKKSMNVANNPNNLTNKQI